VTGRVEIAHVAGLHGRPGQSRKIFTLVYQVTPRVEIRERIFPCLAYEPVRFFPVPEISGTFHLDSNFATSRQRDILPRCSIVSQYQAGENLP